MSEPRAIYDAGPRQRARRTARARAGRPSADDAGFPGCKPVPMSHEEVLQPDGRRMDYWDEAGVAWVCEPVLPAHEVPSTLLAVLLDRIADARGAPILCCGHATFYERKPGTDDRYVRAMEADQTVYLDPARARALQLPPTVLGSEPPPDVVLEVDHTTDVRRRKLGEYERWRFPEVWVEVPEPYAGRRSRRRTGLTIHVLETERDADEPGTEDAKPDAGPDTRRKPPAPRYREVAQSRALPGWTAEEIHRALNEPVRSAQTLAALARVGRTLGQREGSVPTHDPQLRRRLAATRGAGRRAGRGEAKAAAVKAILDQRGIPYSPDSLTEGRLAALAVEPVVAAALACRDEADFLARVAAGRPSKDE